MGDIRIFPNLDQLSIVVANAVIEIGKAAIADKGTFSIALSGGSTPRSVYRTLSAKENINRLDWMNTHFFWGDERSVPPDHHDSNYRMANETLLCNLPTPPENIYRIQGELDPIQAATIYERQLRAYFFAVQGTQEEQTFDLVLLGMGSDGHTASLFPYTDGVSETEKWVVANYVDSLNAWRITLSQTTINLADHVFFIVSGPNKAERLAIVLQGTHLPQRYPAQLIQPISGNLVWFVDQPAADLLSG